VLISVAIVWGYAHLLTVMGAYKHASDLTASNCRTDRASLVVSSPWYGEIRAVSCLLVFLDSITLLLGWSTDCLSRSLSD
jgi:hypothetical protein